MRKVTAIAGTLSVATALLTMGAATAALADPPSGTTPAFGDIVGVGANTDDNLFNAISLAADNAVANGKISSVSGDLKGAKLYSYTALGAGDATGTTITTKAGAVPIARPNGSSPGIAALESNNSDTVDYARSSRGRAATDPSSISFVALAKDAVTAAVGANTTGVANLDAADLKAIYTCTDTTWATLPDNPVATNTNTILPYLPQTGSGTRTFFETAIGITDSQVGTCVNSSVEENIGNQPALEVANVVFPYSVADALAQTFDATADGYTAEGQTTGTLKFIKVDGDAPAVKSGSTYVQDPAFEATSFGRTIYDVVRNTDSGDDIPAYLEGLFGTKGLLCTYGASLVAQYGFTPLSGSACGAVS